MPQNPVLSRLVPAAPAVGTLALASALRAIPAETTAARATNPNWKSQADRESLTPTSLHGERAATSRRDLHGQDGLHSDQLNLTERFTRIDPEMIDDRIRVSGAAVEGREPVREFGGGKE
jgi:hypothetical protein